MEQKAFTSSLGPLFLMGLFLNLGACLDFGLDSTDSTSNSDTSFVEYIPDTSLAVDPEYFLGDAPCTNNGGGLKSYVATLTDITDSGPAVVLASSSPVSCSRKLVFEYISPQHLYTVEIDGYEFSPEELMPLLGPGSGSRAMLQKNADGTIGTEVLAPRWKTDCETVRALADTRVGFFECDPLDDLGTPPPTSIELNPGTALGENKCVSEGGEVLEFAIKPLDAALPPVSGIACPGQAIVYNAGINAGQMYRFQVEGYRPTSGMGMPGLERHWLSECYAIPKAGQVTKAVCDPLKDKGEILMDMADILKGQTYTCEKSISYYVASIEEKALSSGPLDCTKSVILGPLDPGDYNVRLTLYGAGNTPAFDTLCTAKVELGAMVGVSCPPVP